MIRNMKRKLVITKIAEQVVTAVLENEEVVEIMSAIKIQRRTVLEIFTWGK